MNAVSYLIFTDWSYAFVLGSKFWRFDPSQRPPVKGTYPKPLSNWQGLPDNVDAAFQYTNGYTYFYKDNAYYRFNDRLFAVDPVNPAFPRSTGFWWYGCKGSPKGTIGTPDSRNNNIAHEESDYDTGSDTVGDNIFDAGNSEQIIYYFSFKERTNLPKNKTKVKKFELFA